MKVINLEDLHHGIRVARYSVEIAKKIGLPEQSIKNIYLSGLFHDIGKAYINQSILNKPGKLVDYERKEILKHPIYSYKEILSLGYSKEVALNVLYHHENYDGTGYPEGLNALSIPIGSRILKISDVFDALTTDRPYRNKLSVKEALCFMNKEKKSYDEAIYLIFTKYIASKLNI